MHSNEFQAEDSARNNRANFRASHYTLLSRFFSDQITDTDLKEFLNFLEPSTDEKDSPASTLSNQLSQWLNTPELNHLLKTEYARLFIMPGGIKPYESVYRGDSPLLMQEPWVKVKQFYQECGLKLENPARLPEDHAAVEFSFMLHLIETGNQTAEKDFFQQHIGCWLPELLEDLSQHQHANFYKDVAGFGRGFLDGERRYLQGTMKNEV